jgi:hypothetical protein
VGKIKVTRIMGIHPHQVFRGELVSVPQFIDPAKLRVGAPVTFTADMVYPAQGQTQRRVRR